MLEHRLGEFVDRSAEMAAFTTMVDRAAEKSIAVISGDASTGKSSLLMRMMNAAKQREEQPLRLVHVDWRGANAYDYLAFMREVRRQLGEEHFPALNDLINFFTQPGYKLQIDINATGNISVLNDAVLEGNKIGDISGVVIRDLGVMIPRADVGIDDPERVQRLTATFLTELTKLAETETILFFLDTFENASANTTDWLWFEILGKVREGRIANMLFVICGRQAVPERWYRDVIDLPLSPLKADDIDEYLQRRQVDSAEARSFMVPLLLQATDGVAGRVANQVEWVLRYIEKNNGKS